MTNSCLYEGWVRHRRFVPASNEFRYRVFMPMLDLDEMPDVLDRFWFWSARRFHLAWHRPADYLPGDGADLKSRVRNVILEQTGDVQRGPVRLLTNARYFGFGINPVSYFYCFDEAGIRITHIVAEVTNTPWKERHCYVLKDPQRIGSGAPRALWTRKEFHVSPFMQMAMQYRWHISAPTGSLHIHIENHKTAADRDLREVAARRSPDFDVTMSLRRVPMTQRSMSMILLKYPFMTVRVLAAIYWQAAKLWWKKVPFVPHPGAAGKPAAESQASNHLKAI